MSKNEPNLISEDREILFDVNPTQLLARRGKRLHASCNRVCVCVKDAHARLFSLTIPFFSFILSLQLM